LRNNTSSITIHELLNIQLGDILCTNHRIDDFILLDVEHIPKFKAVLAMSEDKRVVQIAKIIKERENIGE